MIEKAYLSSLNKIELRKFSEYLGIHKSDVLNGDFKSQLGWFINYLSITYNIGIVSDNFSYAAYYIRDNKFKIIPIEKLDKNTAYIVHGTNDKDSIMNGYKMVIKDLFHLINNPF